MTVVISAESSEKARGAPQAILGGHGLLKGCLFPASVLGGEQIFGVSANAETSPAESEWASRHSRKKSQLFSQAVKVTSGSHSPPAQSAHEEVAFIRNLTAL